MPTIRSYPTPNPDSLKFVLDSGQTIIDDGMLVFASAAEAEHHSLGRALFALEGITNVFVLPEFLTVTKETAASWNSLLPGIEQAIIGFLD